MHTDVDEPCILHLPMIIEVTSSCHFGLGVAILFAKNKSLWTAPGS